MPANEWHYIHQGQQFPPVPWNVLVQMARAHQIESNDMIWNEGFPSWMPAGTVQGLIPTTRNVLPFGAHAPAAGRSKLGLISALMGVFFCLFELVLIVIVGVVDAQAGGLPEDAPETALLGSLLLLGGAGAFVGGVLGLVALFDDSSSKVAAAFGVAFNAMCVLGVIGLTIIGLLAS